MERRHRVTDRSLELAFAGEVIHWRGPSPFFFVPVPSEESADIEAVAARASYGWGCIPAVARIAETTWTTSLIPKDGRYLVPLKVVVRRAEGIDLGDIVDLELSITV